MKNISQIVNRVIALTVVGLSLAVLTASLTACGQRGALYLPTTPAGAQRATVLETLTTAPTPPAVAPAASDAPTPVK